MTRLTVTSGSPLFTAARVGALFGPVVFGVTAAGVALPRVATALDASPANVAWVLTAHALALGVGTALFARLASSRGLRAALLFGALILAGGAVVCLLAPSLGLLVAGRLLLAAGSGARLPAAVHFSPHWSPRTGSGSSPATASSWPASPPVRR
jgi:MFS family permease